MRSTDSSGLNFEGIETGLTARAARRGYVVWLLFLLLLTGWASAADAAVRRVATGGSDGSNTCLSANCATIAHALSQADPGDTIFIGYGQSGGVTFSQKIVIDKRVILEGLGNDPSGSNFTALTGTAGTEEAIFTILAEDVEIRNLYFAVDLGTTSQAIRAEPGANGLIVDNVRIKAEGTAPVAPPPVPAHLQYGKRNAIWINPTEGAPFSATVTNSFIEATTSPTLAVFRAGIDARRAGLTATGNSIIAINHDVSVRRQAPGLAVQIGGGTGPADPLRNTFLGYGVYMAEPMADAGSTHVTNNLFQPAVAPVSPATAGDFSAMRLIGNPNGIPVTISGNTFNGHERGILIQNFPGVTLTGNSFTPLASSQSYQHIVLSNKQLFTGTPVLPLPGALSLTATGNTFEDSDTPGGTAIALLNDNAQGEPDEPGYYGAITFNGNDFADDIGLLFHLGDFTCTNTTEASCPLSGIYNAAIGVGTPPGATGTPVAKFAGDVTATGNQFGGVDFGDLTASEQIGLIARTIDISYDAALGFVDYGLLADQDTVYVDATFAGSSYGQGLSFSHTQVSPGTVYFGINAFATIPEGLTKVVDGGTVYIAAGSYPGFTLAKHAVLIGNDSDRDGVADAVTNTLIEGQVTISASGVDASDPVALRNLEVSNTTDTAPANGYGIKLAGSHSFIELTDLRVFGNVQHGLWVDGGASISELVIADSTFDQNGYTIYPGDESLNVGAGFATSQNATAVTHVLIENSDFLDNAFGGIVINNANVGGASQVSDWEIAGGNVLRNNQATTVPTSIPRSGPVAASGSRPAVTEAWWAISMCTA